MRQAQTRPAEPADKSGRLAPGRSLSANESRRSLSSLKHWHPIVNVKLEPLQLSSETQSPPQGARRPITDSSVSPCNPARPSAKDLRQIRGTDFAVESQAAPRNRSRFTCRSAPIVCAHALMRTFEIRDADALRCRCSSKRCKVEMSRRRTDPWCLAVP